MTENNNNTVKPIMVGDITLTQLEQCWDSSLHDDPNDKSEAYDELLKTFQEVCKRLRKEVKRHKKAKRYIKELEFLHEHDLLAQVNELVQERSNIDANFKLMADSFVELLRENKRLKNETWRPIETAPKDGTRVLLYREGYAEHTFVGYYDDVVDYWSACFNSAKIHGVTHWRKLP